MVAIFYTWIVALVTVLILIPSKGQQLQSLLLITRRGGLITRVRVLVIFVELGLKIDLLLQMVVYEPTY